MCSVPGTVIEGRALRGQILTEPAEVFTEQSDLVYALTVLTLGTSVCAILGLPDRLHALTDLPSELVHVVPEIRPVVIFDLGPRGLGTLVHGVDSLT